MQSATIICHEMPKIVRFPIFSFDLKKFIKFRKTLGANIKNSVSLKNFEFLQSLLAGSQGKTWLVRKLDNIDRGQVYVMKVLLKSNFEHLKISERNVC